MDATKKGWRFEGNELKYVQELLEAGLASGTTGSMNMRLEDAFAKRFGIKYAITSNSGTSTLHQALLALGVKPGDEVIIPALTVIMCAFSVLYCHAKPVFADVDPETFLIDPKDVERKITDKTKVIMPVHLYGQVCDMDAIMKIAEKHNLKVLEDCAECFLGADDGGRIGGTIGDVGSFSFQTTKHMTTGDGGMLVTNDEMLAERMRKFGGLGFKHIKADRRQVKKNKDLFQDPAYLRHDTLGYNYRLSELGAAVGLGQIERLDMFVQKRQQMAGKYLEAMEGCDWLKPQKVPTGYTHAYYTFVVKLDKEGLSWYDFRKKYMEFGGDGIYAAWALVYNEPIMRTISEYGRLHNDIEGQAVHLKDFLANVSCPNADAIQPKLLQFTTNQNTEEERLVQMGALKKTIEFFNGQQQNK